MEILLLVKLFLSKKTETTIQKLLNTATKVEYTEQKKKVMLIKIIFIEMVMDIPLQKLGQELTENLKLETSSVCDPQHRFLLMLGGFK